MFYNLSQLQVQKIKTNFYPQEVTEGKFLKSVVVNSYGIDNPDNSLKITYHFNDGKTDTNGKQIFKVFNNIQAKKYMKLKIFEILSDRMLKELKSNNTDVFRDITTLENIIKKYGALSRDLSPSYDFIGDKENIDSHIKLEDGSIDLAYEINFLLARPQIEYLYLGAIFYFDKNAYLADQKVDEKFIDKRILLNKLYVYPLYTRNTLVDGAPVQDLRIIKNSFANLSDLDNLSAIINSDKVYDALRAIKEHKSKNFLKPTSDLENDEKSKQEILKYNESIARKKYFSNIYYSRNSNKFLGLVFNLDYDELIKNNSAYAALIKNTQAKQDYTQKCKISSIKILRRKIEKRNSKTESKQLITVKKDTTETLIDSGEPKDSNLISPKATNIYAIKEIKLKNGKSSLRSFSVTDKTVFFDKKAIYQYGVEIDVADSINEYLISLADTLSARLPDLNNYLEETSKVVRTTYSDEKGYSIDGSYDALKNTFTPKFIASFKQPRIDYLGNSSPSYQQVIAEAAASYVAVLYIFGLLKDNNELTATIKSITNVLNPVNTNANIIQFFTSSYERLINQIYKITKDNYNNNFKIEHWFKNDYVDSTMPINLGYKFFDFNAYDGLGIIDTFELSNRVNLEINKYALNPQNDSGEYENKKYCYVSPLTIYSKDKTLELRNLVDNPDSINDMDYMQLELSILNGIMDGLDASEAFDPKINKISKKTDLMNVMSVASSKLLKQFSINSKNIFIDKSNLKEKQKFEVNNEINLTHLMLGLAKQYDINKKTYLNNTNSPLPVVSKQNALNKINSKITNISAINSLKQITALPILPQPTSAPAPTDFLDPKVPIHINFLLEEKCKLFNIESNYKKLLDLNSKFQFLFNTLHSIEILEYNKEIPFGENWKLLTKEKLNTLENNAIYLCRLRNYRDSTYSVEGIERINLPVYEQHFLLRGINLSNIIASVPLNTFDNIKLNTRRDIINSISKSVAVFVTPAPVMAEAIVIQPEETLISIIKRTFQFPNPPLQSDENQASIKGGEYYDAWLYVGKPTTYLALEQLLNNGYEKAIEQRLIVKGISSFDPNINLKKQEEKKELPFKHWLRRALPGIKFYGE